MAIPTRRRTWRITGQVQGVGFRPFIYRLAGELGLAGSVWNDQSGVTIEAWGAIAALDEFERRVPADAPALARVDTFDRLDESAKSPPGDGFVIRGSDVRPADRGRVTVDSAVCVDCVREMLDSNDRRHGHALINCTNCGPRYTIVRDLPYDRARTTMASFPMCAPCAAEYADPEDRRFHAQPTCCRGCGPGVRLVDHAGAPIDGHPFARSAARLREGGVLAMKGLGGYHLVADASHAEAVQRLRSGKRRDRKPFAIMAPSLEAARRLVRLSPEAETLLVSPVAPIVLAPRRETESVRALAPLVAPGCHRLGVMLPYTPMQHLLFREAPDAVLVMTSANLSDDPLIKDDEEVVRELGEVCDAFLLHDRPIERAVDDSIVIDAPAGVLPVRRARGYVPAPLSVPIAAPRTGLCVGGELKGTVAVVRANDALLSQHLGDLTYARAYRRFERTIDDLQRLFDAPATWIACDAHPRYASHRYAKRLARTRDVELVTVQHHHAHLGALLAEHDRSDAIVGLVCDGVGYGDDGAAWGGEILLGDLVGYRRVGRLRPLRLPGGDAAARRTGRCAASWLHDVLAAEARGHPLTARVLPDPRERELVLALLDADSRCPPSSGMGRLFDAAAALLGVCDYNHHEAMSGMRLEAIAETAEKRRPATGTIDVISPGARGARDDQSGAGGEALMELDHRPLLRRLLAGLETGETAAESAWRFHDALADALARAARRAADHAGVTTIGLSGGVFCNTLLTRRVLDHLAPHDLEVLVHRQVPPNDGGIAYGQAAIAAATLAAGTS